MNTERYVIRALLAKSACCRARDALRRASNATFALCAPALLFELEPRTRPVLLLSAAIWLLFAAHAGVLLFNAFVALSRRDQARQEAR